MYVNFTENPRHQLTLTNNLSALSYCLLDPALIKEFLQAKYQNYEKFLPTLYIDLLFENGLFLTHGDRWKHQRTLMSSFFTFEAIQARMPVIKETAHELLSRLADSDRLRKEGVLLQLQICTGDVMCKTFFGKNFCKLQLNNLPITSEVAQLIQKTISLKFEDPRILFRGMLLRIQKLNEIPEWLRTSEEKKLV